ncbi:chromatin modification-related protein eaf3-like, partial [Sipha flava]|uniref:Chromatin modification-related protein eaf3-like n=1 Tax=Sipha flava TaxID=143950 RepID=A0A8B8F911_9HEMI
DIVFCYYQELLYEAIIRDRRWRKDGVGEYYIHYINWKKNWDEWVDYQNVLVINEVNISHKEFLEKELQKKLEKQNSSKRKKKGVIMKLANNTILSGKKRGRKRKLSNITPCTSATKKRKTDSQSNSGSLYGGKKEITDDQRLRFKKNLKPNAYGVRIISPEREVMGFEPIYELNFNKKTSTIDDQTPISLPDCESNITRKRSTSDNNSFNRDSHSSDQDSRSVNWDLQSVDRDSHSSDQDSRSVYQDPHFVDQDSHSTNA